MHDDEGRRGVFAGDGTRGEEQWLVIEKLVRGGPVEHYVLATLPGSMSRKQLVRRNKQRVDHVARVVSRSTRAVADAMTGLTLIASSASSSGTHAAPKL